jgi:pimeloyl-ACP methyl ester carboxylesterase
VALGLGFFRGQAAFREQHPASDLAPPDGRFVTAGADRIFVQTAGPDSGPPIIFLHGTGAWSELWRSTLDAVGNAGYRAIAIDLPPFGFSDRPADRRYGRADQARRIIGVLDGLGIRRAVLVGHSFGGGPTLEAALRAPDRVEALVLADPAIGLDDPSEGGGAAAAVLSVRPLRNALLSATVTNPLFTGRFISRFVARQEAVTPERIAVLQRPLGVKGSTNALGDWVVSFLAPEPGLLSKDPAAYGSFDRRTLLIWGALDTTTPLAQGQRLAGVLRGSELVVMDGVGHMPQIEAPADFNRILLGFLARAGL